MSLTMLKNQAFHFKEILLQAKLEKATMTYRKKCFLVAQGLSRYYLLVLNFQ